LTTAKDEVLELISAAAGTDETGTKQGLLDDEVAKTSAAVEKVRLQRVEAEKLVAALA